MQVALSGGGYGDDGDRSTTFPWHGCTWMVVVVAAAMAKKGRNAITFSGRKPLLTGKVYENAFYFAK